MTKRDEAIIRPANDPAALSEAVAILRAGGLVGMPTETVYGLAADAARSEAVARIYAAKGRPRFNPLIAHVADIESAERLVHFGPLARRLAMAFWPGPLTLVLPKRADAPVSDLVTAGLDTLAIRIPAHPAAQALLRAFGGALAAPSANRSGHVSATTAAHVADDLGAAVGIVLDAGASPVGVESTILAVTDDDVVLLRAGGVARADIERVVGKPVAFAALDDPEAPVAPGQLASHYAPDAAVRLNAMAVLPGEALIAFGPALPAGAEQAAAIVNLSPRGDLVEAATRLFSALRELDGKAATIAVAPIPAVGLGEAIVDRLSRAAAPRT
ncbi:L-threonylcarbamoyladenylate synthase [Kaistia dalseonensis]|uniref:Threonylcarbamoyl-AMP synthase n=1 Tax=Kaistia dalseonensis TaxID=410840 RepID=A0ABU0HDZ2_9HYPH|nr:L-threonylcarbamoyladenylate synthase [Kaistia dalseonensis]MCX5497429.1 L-threonylcarbamoyladenylate synthase [Kaistia dalseonensis]MDQ0440068.1 L-threonylcarbamoyladenylate synthase [Kaistia dalseonensis]